jgi:hypothetical protein
VVIFLGRYQPPSSIGSRSRFGREGARYNRVSAPVVGAVNQEPANTDFPHFTEAIFCSRAEANAVCWDRGILGSSRLVIHLVRN